MPDYNFPEHTLAGRVILLAGGTGGLGAATAALLAKEGATVVLGYRANRARAEAVAAEVRRNGPGPVHLVEGDLARAEAVERYLARTAEVGEVYGVVAFVGAPARVASDAPLADWLAALDASWKANFVAPIALARTAARRMQAAGTPGSIVLFSTMQAHALFEHSIPYAAPKAALAHAARILAKELRGKSGIRVNVIAPGVIAAGMAEASIRSGKYGRYIEEGVIPRFGRPEDVARAVRFLLEPDSYVTGQVVRVDGGIRNEE